MMALHFLHLAAAAAAASPWYEAALARITPPVFRAVDYDIHQYGAAVPDGRTDARDAIKAAITACNRQGGGRVVVPGPGTYYVAGPIHMKANVELHVAAGATLKFSSSAPDFLKEGLTLTRFEGTEVFNYSPLIYGYQLTNVAITGGGTLDGSGQAGFAQWASKQGDDQNAARQMGNDTTAVCTRQFGEGHFLRPAFVQMMGCRNLLVEGVTIVDSPFWVVHPVYSTNVIVRNINITSPHINNDGVDPESSVDVLIENSYIVSGDDCVSIKSGRDADGWRVGQPSENIIVRNLTCSTSSNAICVGSEMSGAVRRVFVDGYTNTRAGNVIGFKSNKDRGASIEDVLIRNIYSENVKGSTVSFTNNYHSWRGGDFPTIFNNFTLENVHTKSEGGHTPISITGLLEQPITNVTITNLAVDGYTGSNPPATVTNAEGIVFNNVTVNGKAVPSPNSN